MHQLFVTNGDLLKLIELTRAAGATSLLTYLEEVEKISREQKEFRTSKRATPSVSLSVRNA